MRARASVWFVPVLVLAMALAVLVAPAWAGIGAQPPAAGAPAIHLQAGTFAPSVGEQPDLPAELVAGGASLSATGAGGQALVQYEGPILSEWRDALEASGATIIGYVPDFAYHVELDATHEYATWAEEAGALEGVIWVGPYEPGYRVSPDALDASGELLRVDVARDPEGVAARLPAMGVRLIAQEGNVLTVEAEGDALAALARLPEVSWVGLQQAPPVVHNDVATGQVHADRAWSLGFQGSGQIVNVADTGLDSGQDYPQTSGDMHPDLENRVLSISSWPVSSQWAGMMVDPFGADDAADRNTGHGTHVAGSAVGSGAQSFGQYRGVAPGAGLTFQALERWCDWKESVGWSDGYCLAGVPANLNDLFAEAYAWGARINNVSWGNNGASDLGAYDHTSREADEFVYAHRDAVIVVAAGNEGRDANGDGLVDLGSVVPPATAKNVIAVGATENYRPSLSTTYGERMSGRFGAPISGDGMSDAGIDGLMASSGRGPTRDGRQAPHIVAPGTWIASLRSRAAQNPLEWPGGSGLPADYIFMGGTSMSAPQVTGAAALVRQAYAAQGHSPSAALVKATLIQTAYDVPGQYPGYDEAGAIPNANEGWGALNAEAAVLAASAQEYVDETQALSTGETATYHYVMGSAAAPARFTLVWSDPAALQTVSKQLVNDLDLEVVDPEGRVYRGNVLPGGWSATGGSADRANNVEAVRLAAPRAGVYTVRVRGYNVPLAAQNFALLANLPARTSPPPVAAIRLPYVARGLAAPAPLPTPTPGPTRTPRPTVTPQPTSPTPTPTLAPGEFRDDFSAKNGTWTEASTGTYSMTYTAGGAYAIRVQAAKHKVGSLPGIAGADDLLFEVDARATVTGSQAYGLILNSGTGLGGQEEYHAFLVSPGGWWTLMRSEADGDWLDVEWTESPAINTGGGENRLGVRREGQRVDLMVNGVVVRTLQGSAYTGGQRVGLLVASWGPGDAEAAFDNVRFVPLGGAALQAIGDGRAVEGASTIAPPP